mgnify:CR=1 FL=1
MKKDIGFCVVVTSIIAIVLCNMISITNSGELSFVDIAQIKRTCYVEFMIEYHKFN